MFAFSGLARNCLLATRFLVISFVLVDISEQKNVFGFKKQKFSTNFFYIICKNW